MQPDVLNRAAARPPASSCSAATLASGSVICVSRTSTHVEGTARALSLLSESNWVLEAFSSFYPLSEEKIKELQQSGLLPSPLPKYSIPLWDYIFGYSLWIILGFAIGAVTVKPLLRRASKAKYCPSCRLILNQR